MIPVFFSCEHATCAVPEPWRELFRGHEEAVVSAEGWEPGALNLAQGFSINFRTPLAHGEVTRLLIDLEKDGDARWSRVSSPLTDAQKAKLCDRHLRPFRDAVHSKIKEALRRESLVVHVLIRVGLAEEGVVSLETVDGDLMAGRVANSWAQELRSGDESMPASAVCVPSVSAVGMSLREEFGVEHLAVVVLRVSQSYFLESRPWRWPRAKKRLIESLEVTIKALIPAPECSSSAGD